MKISTDVWLSQVRLTEFGPSNTFYPSASEQRLRRWLAGRLKLRFSFVCGGDLFSSVATEGCSVTENRMPQNTSYTFKNVLFYVVLTLADNYKHYLTMLIKFFLLFCGIRIIWSLPVSELSLNCQSTRPAQIPSQLFATLKRKGNWNRNVSRSCFWDGYSGTRQSAIGHFFLSPVTAPEIFANFQENDYEYEIFSMVSSARA